MMIGLMLSHIIYKAFLLFFCQSMAFWFLPIMAFLDLSHYTICRIGTDITITNCNGENRMSWASKLILPYD